ncbi:MAG: TraR/DksA C4-type zinc finger protein [Candidatus Zixiibacteriota bacterium]
MRTRDMKKYEKLLLERRREVLREMGLLRESVADATTKEATGDHSSYSYHMADQGTDAMEREKTFMFASKSQRFLYHIDEALRRIKDKTYGKCAKCDSEIGTARLTALPHARFCIKCKEEEESDSKKRR